MSNPDILLGEEASVNSNTAKFLEFREKATSVDFIELDNIPGITSVGEGISFEANLYEPGTDLFDDIPDEVLGTKSATYTAVNPIQLGNGDFILNGLETITLPDGEIFAEGRINATALERLEPQKIQITGGSGIYDNAHGIETIQQVFPDVFDVVDISLVIGG